jgi:glutamate/tyrosine decarboxylase-like PLP-dependent enzyme
VAHRRISPTPCALVPPSDNGTMRDLLHLVADRAAGFLASTPSRRVGVTVPKDALAGSLKRPLSEDPVPDAQVIEELIRDVDQALVCSGGPRYFGFVIGGAVPASLAADWLTAAWDQNAQVYATSPAASIVEEIVAGWVLELLGLPPHSSVGFVTGGQMANFTALSAARNTVLSRAGWNLEEHGLFGAPPIAVLMSDQAHATITTALRMMGIGSAAVQVLSSDREGRLRQDELEARLKPLAGKPVIICAQAGNVNTGAFEPVDAIADAAAGHNAWIHVDGAFGLWAAVSPDLRHLLPGLERADSWSTDAHKWLNVPYDSGLVIVKRPEEHRSLKTARCCYAGMEVDGQRDGSSWTPENSRRARAFVLYAAIRALGRSGIREMIDRCCGLARQFAEESARLPGARVLNEVVLNQVLLHLASPIRDAEAYHQAVAAEIQRNGRCWIGSTRWKGVPALRISVVNWTTNSSDIAEAVREIGAAVIRVSAAMGTPDGAADCTHSH